MNIFHQNGGLTSNARYILNKIRTNLSSIITYYLAQGYSQLDIELLIKKALEIELYKSSTKFIKTKPVYLSSEVVESYGTIDVIVKHLNTSFRIWFNDLNAAKNFSVAISKPFQDGRFAILELKSLILLHRGRSDPYLDFFVSLIDETR